MTSNTKTPRSNALFQIAKISGDYHYLYNAFADLAVELEVDNFNIRKELEQAKKRISDYGWAEDARNGNIQGQW